MLNSLLQEKNINIKYVLLFLVSLCVLLYLNKYHYTGHDVMAHLDRLNSTVFSLKNGQYPPLFDYRENSKFGYSWNLFYPPLSILLLVISKSVNFLFGLQESGINILRGYNIQIILIGYSVSYFSLKQLNKNNKVAIVGALLFITSHYLMTNLFIRAALPEALAMCFYPLIITGLFLKYQKINNSLFVIGVSLITITHIPSTIITLLFILLFILFNSNKIYLIKNLVKKDAVIYLCLTGWFIFPLIYQMTWIHPAINQPVNIKGLDIVSALINSPQGAFSSLIGIGVLCSISMVVMGINWLKHKDSFSTALFPTMFILLLIITGYIHFKAIDKIQFVWRISGIFVFPAIVVIIDFCKDNINKILIICLVNAVLTTGSIIPNMSIQYVQSYPNNNYIDYIDISSIDKYDQSYKDFQNKNVIVEELNYQNGFPSYVLLNTSDQKIHVKSPVLYYRGIKMYVNDIQQSCRQESRFCLTLQPGYNKVNYKLSNKNLIILSVLYIIFFIALISYIVKFYRGRLSDAC